MKLSFLLNLWWLIREHFATFSTRRALTKIETNINGPGYVDTSCLKEIVALANMKCLNLDVHKPIPMYLQSKVSSL